MPGFGVNQNRIRILWLAGFCWPFPLVDEDCLLDRSVDHPGGTDRPIERHFGRMVPQRINEFELYSKTSRQGSGGMMKTNNTEKRKKNINNDAMK